MREGKKAETGESGKEVMGPGKAAPGSGERPALQGTLWAFLRREEAAHHGSCRAANMVIAGGYLRLVEQLQLAEKKSPAAAADLVFSLFYYICSNLQTWKRVRLFMNACKWPLLTVHLPSSKCGKTGGGRGFEVVLPSISLVVFYGAWFLRTWHVFIKLDVPLPLYSLKNI